jgi:hypothetical protein
LRPKVAIFLATPGENGTDEALRATPRHPDRSESSGFPTHREYTKTNQFNTQIYQYDPRFFEPKLDHNSTHFNPAPTQSNRFRTVSDQPPPPFRPWKLPPGPAFCYHSPKAPTAT